MFRNCQFQHNKQFSPNVKALTALITGLNIHCLFYIFVVCIWWKILLNFLILCVKNPNIEKTEELLILVLDLLALIPL